MSDASKRTRPGSLDELLRTNKERFDQVFANRMGTIGPAPVRRSTPTTQPVSPPVEPARGSEQAAIDVHLDRMFGDGWSAELVEQKITNGTLTALCKLTVDGESTMQFGAAPVSGDEASALEAARRSALEKCAEELSERRATSAVIASRARPEASAARPRLAQQTGSLDTTTIDVIGTALDGVCQTMAAVLFRSAVSEALQEASDDAPSITDGKGRAIVGRPGSAIADLLRERSVDLHAGDAILCSDPYACDGASGHIANWTVTVPVFYDDELVGLSCAAGPIVDVGGPVAGSMPAEATSIFGEGLRIPPVKIYEKGSPNRSTLDVILANTRTPEVNHGDLLALVDGAHAGERRVIELCDRFGKPAFTGACQALLDRANRAMRRMIVETLPEEPRFFEDYVDDDGLGNGPFKMKLTVWREGDRAFFDWTGTSPQAPGPVNFYLNESMFKHVVGRYMAATFDSSASLNDGFHDLIDVTMPENSLVRPAFPAALSSGAHAQSRHLDVLGGVFGAVSAETATAAGYGSRPRFRYSGTDAKGKRFDVVEDLPGGIPGRPGGDGVDGHFLRAGTKTMSTEDLESNGPVVVEHYASVPDSGGAGLHRGGNGIEKIYLLRHNGEVSIQDDRHLTSPWGISGGKPGAVSEKALVRADGTRETLPSKIDGIAVRSGDRIVFRTAGGGGWGDPLERRPEQVRVDVARRLLTDKAARERYGVVLDGDAVDHGATLDLRDSMKRVHGTQALFDFGDRPAGNGATNGN